MDIAQEIKQKLDIVEYIGRYVQLKPSGRNYRGLCPFHQEKTPSFFVNPDRQLWRCFGACQVGGDAIAFLMKWEHITFYEALKELAQETGVKLETTALEDRAWQQKEKLVTIHAHAMKYYNYLLTHHPTGQHAREYLHSRGVNEKIQTTFQLGYAPSSWDSLSTYLIKKGYSLEDLLTAGLVIKSAKGTFYDRFRNRLMFPIIDSRDYVIAFSGRTLKKDAKEAKYINSPETPLYHKRETLYGLHLVKEHIRAKKKAVIVEGEFDMISSYMHGINNVVAVKGSIVTKEQLTLLKKYTDHMILSLDSDFSGTETALRAIQDAQNMDMRIDVISFGFAKDPDEALQKDPVQFKKLLEHPIPLYDFVIQTSIERHNSDDPFEKKQIADEVLPLLNTIENPIIKSHYIKKLAEEIKSEESVIEDVLRTYVLKQKRKRRIVPKQPLKEADKYETMQKTLLACIVQNNNPVTIFKEVSHIINENDFSVPSYKEIFNRIEIVIKTDTEDFIKTLITKLDPPLLDVFDTILLMDTSRLIDNDGASTKKIALHTKKLSIKSALKKRLHGENKSEKEDHLVTDLTQMLAKVEKELALL